MRNRSAKWKVLTEFAKVVKDTGDIWYVDELYEQWCHNPSIPFSKQARVQTARSSFLTVFARAAQKVGLKKNMRKGCGQAESYGELA